METGAILIVLSIAFIFVCIAAYYNSLIKRRNSVDEAFLTMDVYLKKRWELMPNIINCAKDCVEQEASAIEKLISTVGDNGYSSLEPAKKLEANVELGGGIRIFIVAVEQCPQLKTDQNFLKLCNQLRRVEEDIVNARKFYNAIVMDYNNKVDMFPTNIIAKVFKFKKKPMYLFDETAVK